MIRVVAVAVFLLVIALPGMAQEAVSVDTLTVEPGVYDETEVTVTGELVGDYSRRGEHTWLQLNDDEYAETPIESGGPASGANSWIGIRIPTNMFDERIDGSPGRYGQRGPIVAITGTFYHFDPNEGGETYIAASRIEVIDEAMETSTAPVGIAPVVGIALVVLGISLLVAARRRRATA